MLIFGTLNSFADYLTFLVLLYFFSSEPTFFRTGWFVENVLSASLTVLTVRSRYLGFRTKPSKLLVFAVFSVVSITPFLYLTPLGKLFELIELPFSFYIALFLILLFFFLSVEVAKYLFYRKELQEEKRVKN